MSDYIFWTGLILGALLGIPSSIVANLIQSKIVGYFTSKKTEYVAKKTKDQQRYADLADKLRNDPVSANAFFAANQIILTIIAVLAMGMVVCSHVANVSPVGIGENTVESIYGVEFYRQRAWSMIFLVMSLIMFGGLFQLFFRLIRLVKALEQSS